MKTALLVVMACILAIAIALFLLMLRRDDPILGLAGIAAAMCDAMVALTYSGLVEQ